MSSSGTISAESESGTASSRVKINTETDRLSHMTDSLIRNDVKYCLLEFYCAVRDPRAGTAASEENEAAPFHFGNLRIPKARGSIPRGRVPSLPHPTKRKSGASRGPRCRDSGF